LTAIVFFCFVALAICSEEYQVKLVDISPCQSHNSTHYVAQIGWNFIRGSPTLLSVTLFNPKCINPDTFCKKAIWVDHGSENCGEPLTIQAPQTTSIQVYIPHDLDNDDKEVARYIALHDKSSGICSWGKVTLEEAHPNFLSFGKITCGARPSQTNPNFSMAYLALLILPLVLLAFAMNRIREAYKRRCTDNSYCCTNNSAKTSEDTLPPLYDNHVTQSNQVQIFPEYPMMFNNDGSQIMNFDASQNINLTPVYTQTYSRPGIQ